MAVYPILSDWDYVRTNAVRVYGDREHWRYIYGGNGELLANRDKAAEFVRKKWAAYPAHFKKTVTDTGHTIDELIDHVTGCRVADCSGFVCLITQGIDPNHPRVPYDMTSGALYSVCHDITTPRRGVCGGMLWRSGHVGIDVSGGYEVEASNEFVDFRLLKITSTSFTKSGRLPWVDYGRMICATDR